MASVVTNRYILADGNYIEVLSLQQDMVAVDTNSATLVERSYVCTHKTFVAGIGERQSKLGTVRTTSKGYRVILLNSILILECAPPVGTCPTFGYLVENVLRNISREITLLTRGVEAILVHDCHILLGIQKLRTLVGI